jgi:hypothetical protein
MGNCRGMIYGLVTSSSDGLPVSPAQVSLNFVQEANGELKVGANSDMSGAVQPVNVTAAGEYVIPFYWSPVKVPDGIASALAMLFYPDGTHLANNQHGTLEVGVDLFGEMATAVKSVGGGTPSVAGAASAVCKFIMAATPELKGLSLISNFVAGLKFLAPEQQCCTSRIDFKFDLVPRVTKVGVKKT